MTSRPGHKGNALTTGFCVFLLIFFMTHFQCTCTRAWRPQFNFSLVPGFSTQGLTFLPRAGFSHFSGINLCDGGSVSLTRLSPFVMVYAPWQPHANKDVFSSSNNSHPETNKTKSKMNQFLSQNVLKLYPPFSDPECHCHRDWLTEAGHNQYFHMIFLPIMTALASGGGKKVFSLRIPCLWRE